MMGTDPETDDYESGLECALCVDELFDGLTPKYVEADVSGVVMCAGVPQPDPNGTFLLTQVLACRWELVGPVWRYRWTLAVGVSVFEIQAGPSFCFTSSPAFECFDTFVNSLIACSPPFVIGHSGYVLCYWGPTIGP